MREVAEEYFDLGLNPVPVKAGTKVPLRPAHQTSIERSEINQFEWEEIGVSTGHASGNLEVLDWDTKNDDNAKATLKKFGDHIGEELYRKLVIQSTPSGGYHMLYRCSEIESNQKLAKNNEGLAIIETRGLGGYIKCYPSEGYEILAGSFGEIQTITESERYSLMVACRMQNRLIVEDNEKRISSEEKEYVSKFPTYENDPKIGTELLESAGWQMHSQNGEWINFTRPGKSISDGISGGYHTEGNFFYCFSTSQDDFTVERPYSNLALYAALVHQGNFRRAYKALHDMGYGAVDDDEDEEIDFLSDETEENSYLDQARKGEIEMGLTTGWKAVDEYLRFKNNSVNVWLGLDNVGKSLFFIHLATASSVLHGWKWGVIAPENKSAVTRQRVIEAIYGKPLQWFHGRDEEYRKCLSFARKRFKIISNSEHYTIGDVVKLGKRLYEKEGISALLIDPWNFFKVQGNGYSVDNEMLSELRIFAANYCSVYIMAHPNTDATRQKKDKEGYMMAPTKYDIQGGSNFAYRVDDFGILHRVINHRSELIRTTLQLRVEKVKEWETGGRPHAAGEYTSLVYEEREGFLGFWDDNDANPMYKYKTAAESAKRRILR